MDEATAADAPATGFEGIGLDFIEDVTLEVAVEFGRSQMTIKDFLQLGRGSIIELIKRSDEPLDIRINGKHVARGEIVVVNDKFGIRVTEIMCPADLLDDVAG